MLTLSRNEQQSIEISAPGGNKIALVVTRIDGGQVKIGIDAPMSYSIARSELGYIFRT